MECLYPIDITTYNLFTLSRKIIILQWKILADTNSNICLYSVLTFPLSFLSSIYWTHLPLSHSFEIIVIKVNMTSTRSNLMVNPQSSPLTSQEGIIQMITHPFLKVFWKTLHLYHHLVLVPLKAALIVFCWVLSSSPLLNFIMSKGSLLNPLYF